MYSVRDFEEERRRTLYVRLPHRIRDPKEVEGLFDGDAKVKLPRQASRACHVIFPNVEEKIKAKKNLKEKTVNGKRVVALNPRTKPKKNKISRKKIVVPEPKPHKENKISQYLFVSNINKETTTDDLKNAFPDSSSITMLDFNSKGLRAAFVKMKNIQVAEEYIKNERELPVVRGNRLSVSVDTRRRKTRRGSKVKKLKIYDEDGKATGNKFETLNKKENNEEMEAGGDSEQNDESESDADAEME